MQSYSEVISDITQREIGLDWKQRPADVKAAINNAYEVINRYSSSQWGCYNGDQEYSIAGISDHLVIEKMILARLNRGQTQFVLMDIGAGDFVWGRSAANFINNHVLFNTKIKVSIYSLRGEQNNNANVTQKGICTLFEYGSFKIENLIEEFSRRGDNLIDNVDLIVSAWCFTHLVDPTGTLLQAYELLRPKTGMIFIDGFSLETHGNSDKTHTRKNIIDLVSSFQAPFFRKYDDCNHRLDCFVMQKSDTEPHIPLTYIKARVSDGGYHMGSLCVTVFEPRSGWGDKPDFRVVQIDQEVNGYVSDGRFWLAPNGELLFKSVILDHGDIMLAKNQKVIELFSQVDISENEHECEKNIFTLLIALKKLDTKQALICIDTLLSLNKSKALHVLNYLPENDRPLLQLFSFTRSGGVSPLFKKLAKNATVEVLNFIGYAGTLLMQAIAIDNRTMAELLLTMPNIDVTVAVKGKTALSIAIERSGVILKEVQYLEKALFEKQEVLAKALQKQKEAIIKFDAENEVGEQNSGKSRFDDAMQKNIDENKRTVEYYIKRRDKELENLKEAKQLELTLKIITEKQQSSKLQNNVLPAFAHHKKMASCEIQPKLNGITASMPIRKSSLE